MNVLLEPSIYELVDLEYTGSEQQQYVSQVQHLKFLTDTLNYIIVKSEDGCDLNLTLSQLQFFSLCNLYQHPWNQYTKITSKNVLTQTFNKIMQLHPIIEDLISYIPAIPSDTMNNFYGSKNFAEYCKHITYAYQNDIEIVVFYGRLNNLNKSCVTYTVSGMQIDIYPIYNISDMFNDSIRKILLSNPKYQRVPTTSTPLPNDDICRSFISIRNQLIKSGEDKISVYKKVGREVALRNHYCYNSYISSINGNSGCIREIFRSNEPPYVYASIDVRHGNFEICDSLGHHIDEYTYDNIPQNKRDSSGRHDIILHK